MISFYKYQGCGNDFILIDARNNKPQWTKEMIAFLCDRRFGIGADGLMYLLNSNDSDFEMEYYNSDGGKSTFCGNGGRCIVAFAKFLGIISNTTQFSFNNIIYKAHLQEYQIDLYMQNIQSIQSFNNDFTIHTGSPHYVHFTKDVTKFDLIPFAKNIRYSSDFPEGINVNIVEILEANKLKIRTYERGVEDETYSCGTGVTAAALAYAHSSKNSSNTIEIETKGGNFTVSFKPREQTYEEVILSGPAVQVFKGELHL